MTPSSSLFEVLLPYCSLQRTNLYRTSLSSWLRRAPVRTSRQRVAKCAAIAGTAHEYRAPAVRRPRGLWIARILSRRRPQLEQRLAGWYLPPDMHPNVIPQLIMEWRLLVEAVLRHRRT